MKFLKKFSYDFIDFNILSYSDHILRHLKPIQLIFLIKKYDDGIKSGKF